MVIDCTTCGAQYTSTEDQRLLPDWSSVSCPNGHRYTPRRITRRDVGWHKQAQPVSQDGGVLVFNRSDFKRRIDGNIQISGTYVRSTVRLAFSKVKP